MKATGIAVVLAALLASTHAQAADDASHMRVKRQPILTSPSGQPEAEDRMGRVSSYSSMVMHHDYPETISGGLTVQEPPKGWPFSDPSLQQAASNQHMQIVPPPVSMTNVGSTKAPKNINTVYESDSDRGQSEGDLSALTFVHSELKKNQGIKKPKGVLNRSSNHIVTHSSSEPHPGVFGPRQPRLDDDVVSIHFPSSASANEMNHSKQSTSSQNFQIFHGGQFTGPQQTSYDAQDVKPTEMRPEDRPMRKHKKKKNQRPQGQNPSSVNVGYTIGFVAQPDGVRVPVPERAVTTTGPKEGNDEIIVGKPHKWKGKRLSNLGATSQEASTQNQVVHMLQPHTQLTSLGATEEVPTIHHILHNEPLSPQQLTEIFSKTYDSNKLYRHSTPSQDIDYQIEMVPEHQHIQQQPRYHDNNGHVMVVAQDSPTSETIFYPPQKYHWKNVGGVQIASSIPVTEDQTDDIPNPHHIQPTTPRPQTTPPSLRHMPNAQALHQAPPTTITENGEQYVYIPVLEDAPSQHTHQTLAHLQNQGQTFTFAQALPFVRGPTAPSQNFDHNKALTNSVGFDYSNAMVTMPLKTGHNGNRGAGAQSGRGQEGVNFGIKESYILVEDGKPGVTHFNPQDLSGENDIKIEYIDVDDSVPMGHTSNTHQGLTFELPKKLLGLPAEFPKGTNYAQVPVMQEHPNMGHSYVISHSPVSNEHTYAQVVNNAHGRLRQSFNPGMTNGHKLNFSPEMQVIHGLNMQNGPSAKGVFKHPNILQLQGTEGHYSIAGINGPLNSNTIPHHQQVPNPGPLRHPGNSPGRVTLSKGVFSGEGIPIAGMIHAGVPPFAEIKQHPMKMGPMGNLGYRGGRIMHPPRFVQNFPPPQQQYQHVQIQQPQFQHQQMHHPQYQHSQMQQSQMQHPQMQQSQMQHPQFTQSFRPPTQGVLYHQVMMNQGPSGRPLQFPPPQQSSRSPPPPMGPPIVLSMNTLNHHHAVRNALRNAQQQQHNKGLRPNMVHIDVSASNTRPVFPHPMMFHRERQALKPRENQNITAQMEKDRKEKRMQQQRNELAKYNSMLSVALFKPASSGKAIPSQYAIKNGVKSAEFADFPITSSFTLDLKPPKLTTT